MRTVNINVVRGHSYENFQHENLSYKTFLDLWYVRSCIHQHWQNKDGGIFIPPVLVYTRMNVLAMTRTTMF